MALIIFFGDSITRDWPLSALAPDEAILNRGIAGETTGQMRLRFGAEVLDRRPDVVHLLGGINDIAENQGFVETETVVDNLAAMMASARAAELHVVAGLLLPCTIVRKRPHLVPQPRIREVNARIRAAAAELGGTVANYFSPLVDATGNLRTDCSDDGLHPNGAGYALMHPVASAAIAQARQAQ